MRSFIFHTFFIYIHLLIFSSFCTSTHYSLKNFTAVKKTKHFLIYIEPQIRNQKEEKIKFLNEIQNKLKFIFFPHLPKLKKQLSIFLYRDYNKNVFFKKHPYVRSYYQRSQHAIHISIRLSKKIWIHEFVHALLESSRPKTQRWVHEGLANFIEQQYKVFFREKSINKVQSCQKKLSLSIPRILQYIPKYIKYEKTLDLFFQKNRKLSNIRYNQISTLFFYYLWEKQSFFPFVNLYHKKDIETRYVFESILGIQNTKLLLNEFYLWLKSKNLKKNIIGC